LVYTDDTVAFMKDVDEDLETIFAFDIIYAIGQTASGKVYVCDLMGLNALLMTILKKALASLMPA